MGFTRMRPHAIQVWFPYNPRLWALLEWWPMQSKHVSSAAHGLHLYQAIRLSTWLIWIWDVMMSMPRRIPCLSPTLIPCAFLTTSPLWALELLATISSIIWVYWSGVWKWSMDLHIGSTTGMCITSLPSRLAFHFSIFVAMLNL